MTPIGMPKQMGESPWSLNPPQKNTGNWGMLRGGERKLFSKEELTNRKNVSPEDLHKSDIVQTE